MADRTDQKTVERDSVADDPTGGLFDEEQAAASEDDEGFVRSRLPSIESIFSVRTFFLRAVLLLVGAFGAGFLPFVGGVLAVALGVFGVAFVIGLVADERRYIETAAAGGLLGGALALARSFSIAFASGNTSQVASVGLGIGLVASLLGLYFGRDLRNGLQRDIGDAGDTEY
jgi:hypothetical protein